MASPSRHLETRGTSGRKSLSVENGPDRNIESTELDLYIDWDLHDAVRR